MPGAPVVVGIGASAGGLEALERFLGAALPLTRCAFVIVQHLSAEQPSLLGELLQRATSLPVQDASDGQRLEAGCVYVGPPGFELQVQGGRLRLHAVDDPHRARLPIDAFLRSLADDQHEAAIGVILSGMGSDGTLGLRAIKDHGGATFVQAPETAQFDSMPRSAIRAGIADGIGAPAELPAQIASYLGHRRQPVLPAELPAGDAEALDAVIGLLRRRSNHDFSMYKKSTVQRRIERRMALHQRRSLADYLALLRENAPEIDLLFKELLIGVTSFFRDAPVWEALRHEVAPALLAARAGLGELRVWVAACSTGEEVYSIAMVLLEALDALPADRRVALKIFATDIDADAIERARIARYPLNIAADVSPERLARFFVQDDAGYVVHKEVRAKVIFALQNVARDPPFTKLDLLLCRNLLIYFEPSLQRKLLPLFHHSLEPHGVLVLGNAESVASATDCFAPLPGKHRLFRRLESLRRVGFLAFPATFDRPERGADRADDTTDGAGAGEPNLQALADQLLLRRYAPAAVLVTAQGDVLYVSGRTGKYLEPAAGKANWNIFAMAREGLGQALNHAFRDAVRGRHSVTVPGVRVAGENGAQFVRLTVDPIVAPKELEGMVMVVFADAPGTAPEASGPASRRRRVGPAEHELGQAQEALRAAREDAQTAEEQSRAASEELQSTNEELQSTNEELTTSKEEMQSMNEELQTINQELQAKVDELSQASDDMRNLLNSTDIATLFLDEQLRIRRYTLQSVSLFKLIATDVGRPITDITNDLKDWQIDADAREVLATLVFREREVAASGKRWFTVRTMPYRTFQNRIDGVVITFADITTAKLLEQELRAAKAALEQRLDIAPVAKPKPAAKKRTAR